MNYREPVVDILMYHSIAEDDVATAISRDVFKMQMDVLEKAAVPVVSLDDLVSARAGQGTLPDYSVIITFDDAFVDYKESAYPILRDKGFPSTVYVPTSRVGLTENWNGSLTPPRPLMSWDDLGELAQAGVEIGSHTVTHPDLDALKMLNLADEIKLSKAEIDHRLGIDVKHFAPPYGGADYFSRTAIERVYATSVGTRLDRVTAESDIMDLPRLEMFYFKRENRWRDQVTGKGRSYLARRRTLRQARLAVNRPWESL